MVSESRWSGPSAIAFLANLAGVIGLVTTAVYVGGAGVLGFAFRYEGLPVARSLSLQEPSYVVAVGASSLVLPSLLLVAALGFAGWFVRRRITSHYSRSHEQLSLDQDLTLGDDFPKVMGRLHRPLNAVGLPFALAISLAMSFGAFFYVYWVSLLFAAITGLMAGVAIASSVTLRRLLLGERHNPWRAFGVLAAFAVAFSLVGAGLSSKAPLNRVTLETGAAPVQGVLVAQEGSSWFVGREGDIQVVRDPLSVTISKSPSRFDTTLDDALGLTTWQAIVGATALGVVFFVLLLLATFKLIRGRIRRREKAMSFPLNGLDG